MCCFHRKEDHSFLYIFWAMTYSSILWLMCNNCLVITCSYAKCVKNFRPPFCDLAQNCSVATCHMGCHCTSSFIFNHRLHAFWTFILTFTVNCFLGFDDKEKKLLLKCMMLWCGIRIMILEWSLILQVFVKIKDTP